MNKNPNRSKIYQEDKYLFSIFIMMAIAIFIKSYFNINGYLSPDSTAYLKLAQNLLEGKGYYVSAYGSTGQDKEFFAIWPVGYSTLIFLTSKLTSLSVFWASKVLNLILIGAILGIFRLLFKQNAYIYGLILFFSAYIEIFSSTWSETIFIATLVWFSASLYLLVVSPHRIGFIYLSIMLASLLLFLSRYIGAFSFGIIGLFGLYYGLIKKERVKGIILISIAIINITIVALYLYHNYTETGFLTGMKRIPSPETNLQLFYILIKAIIVEMLIPIPTISMKAILVFFVQFSIVGFLLWKYQKNILSINTNINKKSIILSLIFGSIGLVYLFFIILMRWISQFDEYNHRLLAPGSFLIFIAIIFYLQQRGTKEFLRVFKGVLFLFAILSYLIGVPYNVWKSSTLNPTYFESLKMIKEKYADIEKNSIVIFASIHIDYLYTNMQRRNPFSLPYHDNKEKFSDFIKRIDPSNKKHIYMVIPKKKLSSDKYDKSVIDIVSKYPKGILVKLK